MYDLNVLYGTAKNQAPFLVWNIGYTHTFSRKPTVWVAGISIVLTPDEKHTNPNVTHTVTELSGQSADINDGFGGSFVWVHPILTTDRSQAITGIKLHILKAEISGWGENVGQGRGSGGYNYRYLETVREEGKPPITGLSFLRSDKAASCPPHFKDYTGDINDKRGGSFLYLCWRTWDEWTLDD
ncbi:hypothetical protein BT69DRAFT_1277677 [Atractiella rhizophila]|nr:hypothetical protein BT69DRAFT_1277677 [Atractiella rhizophila]